MAVAVITGASSGIGRSTAEEFARRGYDLLLLARRRELLDNLCEELGKTYPSQKILALTCDISKWAHVEESFGEALRLFPAINVLINNAGAFDYRSLKDSGPEKLDSMIDVNVRGMVYVTKAALPLLKKAVEKGERAKIVNVSSISGLWGFSNMSVYTATKFAVAGFSSGLRRELAPEKIEVSTIFPGPVNTKPGAAPSGSRKLVMFPPQIATQIYKLAHSRKHNLVSHPAFSVLHLLESLSPRMVDRVLKRII